MFEFLKKLFKKNPNLIKLGLREAKEKGFITEEEFLMLESKRADDKYKEFLKKKK